MPDGFTDAMTAIQTGLQQLPPVVVVIGMLFGPTLAWFGYRYYRSPKTNIARVDGPEVFWICRECRSANQPRARRCYGCGLDAEQETGPISVVDHGAIVELEPIPVAQALIEEAPALPLVAVGPGYVDTDLPPPIPVLVADDLPELYWVCQRCRLPNGADDRQCHACGRDRAAATTSLRVIGGVDVSDPEPGSAVEVRPREPVAPKVTKPRRAVASVPAKRRSTRRDAAS